MSNLAEIEQAAEALPWHEQERLFKWLAEKMDRPQSGKVASHSVLDIIPVSLGQVIRPLASDDDLLGEMLEDRP